MALVYTDHRNRIFKRYLWLRIALAFRRPLELARP